MVMVVVVVMVEVLVLVHGGGGGAACIIMWPARTSKRLCAGLFPLAARNILKGGKTGPRDDFKIGLKEVMVLLMVMMVVTIPVSHVLMRLCHVFRRSNSFSPLLPMLISPPMMFNGF